MDELRISIRIADRPYRLTIKKEEEEIVRKAAKEINERLKEYAGNYAFNDKQDLISMVAILFATRALSMERKLRGKNSRIMDRLAEIEKVLSGEVK